jgi:GrpB-like predicted nucleotidyltransferase (UPF0157 family)
VADGSIVLVTYDPAWAQQFEAERALLERALAPWLEGGVHHVGSTAIPGIAAKPIIDMIAGVRDLEAARAAFDPLSELSYAHAFHRPGTHWFYKPPSPSAKRTHQLHLTEPGSDLWRERLAFRDALRADAALAAEYEALKLRLAEEHRRGRLVDMAAAKRPFVAGVLAGAGIELRPR